MTLRVEEDVPADPRDVRLLGAPAVMARPECRADAVEKARLRRIRRARLTSDEGTSDRTADHPKPPLRSRHIDHSPSEGSTTRFVPRCSRSWTPTRRQAAARPAGRALSEHRTQDRMWPLGRRAEGGRDGAVVETDRAHCDDFRTAVCLR